MTLAVVTLREIEQIFTVIDRIGVSREAVVIPLKPATPGHVRRMPNGKYEIVVDGARPLDEQLVEIERRLLELEGRSG